MPTKPTVGQTSPIAVGANKSLEKYAIAPTDLKNPEGVALLKESVDTKQTRSY
jgi:hypothetical protein